MLRYKFVHDLDHYEVYVTSIFSFDLVVCLYR